MTDIEEQAAELGEIQVGDPLRCNGTAYEIKSIDEAANKVVCEKSVRPTPETDVAISIRAATDLVNDC